MWRYYNEQAAQLLLLNMISRALDAVENDTLPWRVFFFFVFGMGILWGEGRRGAGAGGHGVNISTRVEKDTVLEKYTTTE